MTHEVRLRRGVRVVALGGAQLTSLGDWVSAVDQATTTDGLGVGALLMDFRGQAYAPSAEDAGKLLDRLRSRFGRAVPPLAAVATAGAQFGGTRVLCTLAELGGCRASAFVSEAEAWLWLRAQLREPASTQPTA